MAQETGGGSYLEVVDALRQHGAQVKDDLEQLWRRIIFYVLISNREVHLRNLGFLYRGRAGWSLSPAYDLNPVPVPLKPRVLTTNIDLDDGTASLDLALSVAEYFNLKSVDAKAGRHRRGRQRSRAMATEGLRARHLANGNRRNVLWRLIMPISSRRPNLEND